MSELVYVGLGYGVVLYRQKEGGSPARTMNLKFLASARKDSNILASGDLSAHENKEKSHCETPYI